MKPLIDSRQQVSEGGEGSNALQTGLLVLMLSKPHWLWLGCEAL